MPTGAPEEQRHAERRRGEQRRIARAVWQGAVALLLGVIALALAVLGGWRILGIERALEHDRSADQLAGRDTEALRTAIAKLEAEVARQRNLTRGIEPLARELELANRRLAVIEDRIEAPERAVARVEANHLVELAIHRLALERDVKGAVRLYEAALARLAASSDAGSAPLRARLDHDLALLRAVPEPDVGALGARLAAAGAVVRDLPILGTIKSEYVPPGRAAAPAAGLARAWQQLQVLGDLVSVRRISAATVQVVSMEEIGVRRHHLETLLFAARLAALRGDDVDYAASLADARDWLGRFFDVEDPRGRALATELAALARSRVSPALPDLAPTLALLRQGRR